MNATPADSESALSSPKKRPRSPRAGLIGPLFSWELIRLARRGQDTRARAILAGGLLVVLTIFTAIWFYRVPTLDLFLGTSQFLTIEESASFGTGFAVAFLLTQLAVLILLTPAYAAGGIADEKERKTFDFLLVSDLTNREILFGKFLGRLVFLLGVMFAGLPVLAMTQVYGGVSITFLLLGYFLTGTTVTMLAATAVASAAYAETFRGALYRAYAIAALHAFAGCGLHPLLSPFGVILLLYPMLSESLEAPTIVAAIYGSAQLVVAMVAIFVAFRGIRRSRAGLVNPPRPITTRNVPIPVRPIQTADQDITVVVEDRTNPTPLPVAKPLPPVAHPLDDYAAKRSQQRHPITRVSREYREPASYEPFIQRPAIDDDDPFLWKEKHVTGMKRDEDDASIRGLMTAGGILVGVVIVFMVLLTGLILVLSGANRGGMAVVERLLLLGGSVGVFCHLLSVGSAACGTICRERTRMTLESLLTIPVTRMEILWAKWRVCAGRGSWWGGPAAVCVVLAVAFGEAPIVSVSLIASSVCGVLLALNYGIWLSIRIKTMTRAILWFLPLAGCVVLIPVVAWRIGNEWNQLSVAFTVICIAFVMLLAAAGFWFAAIRSFEHYDRN